MPSTPPRLASASSPTSRWAQARNDGSNCGSPAPIRASCSSRLTAIKTRIGTFQGISFIADNLHKTYEELKGRGVEFSQPPTKQSWGEFCVFKDVDGNQFVMSGR